MKIYNSLNRQKEEFIPIIKNQIKMYVCGQTVYDYCHLGHARKALVFDMIRKWFITLGYKVLFVENITDIDDKIIHRAMENNETINQLTQRFTNYMHEDFDQLGIMRPDLQPQATNYIPQMIAIIENLIAKDFAYRADNGDIYYAVRKFANYGKLSGKALNELRAGERVDIDKHKKDPLDFVLWKAAKDNEPYWHSPFGKGRPGWHIECSAMADELLGKNFDIHGGGQDLQFPHHENEIAQSEAHNGCKFANYWLHNGFLNINDEKMSKSLGNFFTLRDILKEYPAEVIRLFMLKTHYRSPLNFNHHGLEDTKHNLTRLYTAIKDYSINPNDLAVNWDDPFAKKFKLAMNDDFNTALAISILFELVGEINKQHDLYLAKLLVALANILGLLTHSAETFFHGKSILSQDEIAQLIIKRKEARAAKDFALADKIRQDLLSKGIILEDGLAETTWRKE